MTASTQLEREAIAFEEVTLARHPDRPRSLAVIRSLFADWVELHGDELFSDDLAILGGPARFEDRWVMVIGQEKGTDALTRMRHNFGMPHPEGYRKAQRLMRLAEKFRLPLICLIDTPAAHAGIGAEERGQAWAISASLLTMYSLAVPTISVVLSEGGSGGALALGMADEVVAFENAMYTVAPPETCAAILYRDANQKARAALAMKPGVKTALELGIVDELVPEVDGGVHLHPEFTLAALRGVLRRHLRVLGALDANELRSRRAAKYGVASGQVRAPKAKRAAKR